ncbi:MAG: sugar ABC transporter permease [Clostridium sp.]|nr:sugar ABC transporter permease [Clostridium sp.]
MSTNKETAGVSRFHLGAFLTKNSMVIALIIVFILFYFLTDGRLLYAQNMSNLLLQNGYVLVMACGMLLCILTGGNIDLSVGSVICMVGGIAAVFITNHGVSAFLTIPLCILVGLLAGVLQGYLIGYVRIPPFITTLSGMFIFRGFGRLILDSKTAAVQDTTFLSIFTAYIKIPGLDTDTHIISPLVIGVLAVAFIFYGTISSRTNKAKKGGRQNSALVDYGRNAVISAVLLFYCYLLCQYKGISVMLVWVAAICLIYHFITSKTAFGRYFYAVGGNEKAAQLSGINTNKVYFTAYANMGLLAGLCGLLCLARVGSVNGSTGTSFEMDAIGSCFIGGASAYGGSGTISGVIIGALLLGVINMGMSIMGIGDSWQYVVKGGVLLTAVIFDVVSRRKNSPQK